MNKKEKNMERNNFMGTMEENKSERNSVITVHDSSTDYSSDDDVDMDESAIQTSNNTTGGAFVGKTTTSHPPKETTVTSRSGRTIKKKKFFDEIEDAPPLAPVVTASMKRKTDPKQGAAKMPKIGKTNTSMSDADRKKLRLMEKKWRRICGQIMVACSTHNPDLDRVIKLITDLRGLCISPFLLIKHQPFVETFHKLRQYRGNIAAWPNITDYEKNIFEAKAEEIRELAISVIGNFKYLLRIPQNIPFYCKYMQMREELFLNRVKHLTKAEIFDLIDEFDV